MIPLIYRIFSLILFWEDKAGNLASLSGSDAQKRLDNSRITDLWPTLNENYFVLLEAARLESGKQIDTAQLEKILASLQKADFPLQIITIDDWKHVEEASARFLKIE